MKYKIIALLSQFQQFGMVHRSYGISSVSNAELADHLIENNVITHYSIEDAAGTLKELGAKPIGDNKSTIRNDVF